MDHFDFPIGRDFERPKLVNFSVVTDLPENDVTFFAYCHESVRIGQVFDDLNLLSVYCEATVQLAELSYMEQQYRTLWEPEDDELFLRTSIAQGLL